MTNNWLSKQPMPPAYCYWIAVTDDDAKLDGDGDLVFYNFMGVSSKHSVDHFLDPEVVDKFDLKNEIFQVINSVTGERYYWYDNRKFELEEHAYSRWMVNNGFSYRF